MRFELAPEVQEALEDVVRGLGWRHVDVSRVVCVRSRGSKAAAYARVWAFPKIWQKALGMKPCYVFEVLSEHFDKLDSAQQKKTLIHELLHLPKNFTGGLVPHDCFGKKIDERTVNRIFEQLCASMKAREAPDGVLRMV